MQQMASWWLESVSSREQGITTQCKHARKALESEDRDILDDREKRTENKCGVQRQTVGEEIEKLMEVRCCCIWW